MVAVVDEIPVNATGKVMKDTLRQRAEAHRSGAAG
jgi:acyl-coenzyme A synthetase/AMP-(fatty) acid ligase